MRNDPSSPITSTPSDEFNLSNQRAAFVALEAERRSLGMSLKQMEELSGVSVNSVYAWRSCARSPTIDNAVKIAETFGYEIILRRKE